MSSIMENKTPNPATTTPNIVGHRGFAGLYPENTLIAIEKALELGVDQIEIDVHQSKDGVVVVMHDLHLNRTTTGKGRVGDYTFEALREFHIIYDLGAVKIPSLEEVLQLIDGRATLLIEVKYGEKIYPEIEANIIKLIYQYKATAWCIVQSFKDEVLNKFFDLDKRLIYHKLLVMPYFYSLQRVPFVKEYSIYYKYLTKRFLRKVNRQGKKVNVWTVNQEEDMKKVMAKGVNSIITDRPDVLKKILA